MTRTNISFVVVTVAVLASASLVVGCKSEQADAKLPPAKGEGAAPMPEVPDLGAAPDTTTAGESGKNSSDRTTGTLFAVATANVATKAGGVITKMAVSEGDVVAKGALLFRVDASGANLRLDQAQAARKAAEVGLSSVKVEYDRAVRLREQSALTQAAFDQISAQYNGAKVAIEQADVAVSMARKAVADTAVRAPIAGTVTRRAADVGDTVSTMPPMVVLQLQDHSMLELRFSLPESALGTMRSGTKVMAKFSSEPQARSVEVERIDPVVDPSTRTLTAVATLDNVGRKLRPGMLAEITLGEVAAPSPAAPATEAEQ